MNCRVLVLSSVLSSLALPTSTSLSAQTSPNTIRKYGLRIYSLDRVQRVHVRGAVWMDGSNTQVVIVDRQTPVEIITVGDVINGIFRADDGRAMRVEVKDEATGTVNMTAAGPSVVVGQGLAQNPEWSFIKTSK